MNFAIKLWKLILFGVIVFGLSYRTIINDTTIIMSATQCFSVVMNDIGAVALRVGFIFILLEIIIYVIKNN